jgi:hypothetical protein
MLSKYQHMDNHYMKNDGGGQHFKVAALSLYFTHLCSPWFGIRLFLRSLSCFNGDSNLVIGEVTTCKKGKEKIELNGPVKLTILNIEGNFGTWPLSGPVRTT